MKILMIDDEEITIKGIKDWATEQVGWECTCVDFTEGFKEFESYDPDIIILDWKEGTTSDKGESIFQLIWRKKFRPIIIFSGLADTIDLPEETLNSPLVKKVKKGNNEPVMDYITTFAKYTPSITQIKENLNTALKQSFDVLDVLIKSGCDDQKIVDYVISRRISKWFDKEYAGELKLPAWIQYICPPIGEKILVGDIIRIYADDVDMNSIGNPEEYLAVLTPSCDIANGNVDKVLCAKCTLKKKLSDKTNCGPTKIEKHKDEIKTHLTQGYNKSIVPLPGMPTKLPYMSVQLKDVVLINLTEIALDIRTINKTVNKYFRVASIDSPYREQLVWAHMVNSCRPGVPERDYEAWAIELFN